MKNSIKKSGITMLRRKAMSWAELEQISSKQSKPVDLVNGATNPFARLRLFSKPEKSVRVTFYRDNHAWCP